MSITVLNTSIVTAGTTYVVPANGLTLVSAGVLRVSTSDSGLANLATSDNCDLRVDGTVIGQLSGVQLLSDGTTDSHSLIVGAAGVVQGVTDSGATLQGTGATVFNEGEISSTASFGVLMAGAGVNLGNLGRIASLSGTAVKVSGEFAEIVNSGTIYSSGLTGLDLTGAPSASVVNSGTISGSAYAIQGGSGAELIRNTGLLDGIVTLSSGNDTFNGAGGGAALVLGGQGLDLLRGGDGDDYFRADEANDRLAGKGGDDYLGGGSGRDRILGGDGEDTIIGDAEADTLTGGTGADDFYFNSPYDIGPAGASDHITDFRPGEDRIDLHLTPGLIFLGSGAFTSVAQEVRYAKAKGELQFDMTGDGVTDFVLVLDNKVALTVADLIL